MKKKAKIVHEDISYRIYYVYCELEYFGSKKGLLRLLSGIGRIQGVLETEILEKGVIRITGEFDPDHLLCLVGEYVRIRSLRKSKCFSILYGPEPPKKQTANGNNNNHSSTHPNYHDQNAYYGVPCGYPNHYTQPRIFGNNQLLLHDNQEGEEVEKPESPQNVGVKKSKTGGCCMM